MEGEWSVVRSAAIAEAPSQGFEGFEGENLPIWQEVFFGLEWLKLRLSSVRAGIGVPHGNNRPVILIPGFLGVDAYLTEMYDWLKQIGYKPFMSDIGRNAECPDILSDKLSETVARVRIQTNQRVTLIGHSLGGTLARSVATRRPHQVAQVITLGSPIQSIRAHPLVLLLARLVKFRIDLGVYRVPSCYTRACKCDFAKSLTEGSLPKAVNTAAVYTKTDGVVHWKSCVNADDSLNREVKGTHCGLVFNPGVFEIIAHELYRCQQSKRAIA